MGGLLPGIGGVTALGCTIGQGLSGVSTLSLTSFIALAAMVGGAYVMVKLQMEWLDRTPRSGRASGLSQVRT